MNRKYRQPGYQDQGERREPTRLERGPVSREGPRSPRMTSLGRVIRCAQCGTKLPPGFGDVSYTSQCPQCSADLHSCKNCVFFNPASRFECEEPIPQRISPKDKRADCTFFEIRSTVEKITSSATASPVQTGPQDPREAFENLFKR
jgi:hypothetical protein